MKRILRIAAALLACVSLPVCAQVTDNFTGSSLSGNWTVVSGAFAVSGGEVMPNNGSVGSFAYYNAYTPPNDQDVCISAGSVANDWYFGVTARSSVDGQNQYNLSYKGPGSVLTLGKVVSGTGTQLATGGTTTAGHIYCITAVGTAIGVTDNGLPVSALAVTDGDLASGHAGIFGFGGSSNTIHGSVFKAGPHDATPYTATVVFSQTSGSYSLSFPLTMTTATSGASIYYTTDGSTPTTSSALYSTPITVAATETVKAISAKASYYSPPPTSATYTITGIRTWYVRPDGGPRYDPAGGGMVAIGVCDGLSDVAYSGTTGAVWQQSHAYSFGNTILGYDQHYWTVSVAGTSSATTTPTTAGMDGTVTWTQGGLYPTGTRHCAFNDVRYLWDNQSAGATWVISGGDTVILRRNLVGGVDQGFRVGYDAETGPGGGYTWCVGGTGPDGHGCSNPLIPSGTSANHTRILGENYASCTSDSLKTQLYGGWGVSFVLNAAGASYVDVSCLEVTDHNSCIYYGTGNTHPCGPGEDWASDGVQTNASSTNDTFTDMWVHGFPGRAFKGSIGNNITCLRCRLSYNGETGWDFDGGTGNQAFGTNASWNFLYSIDEWSGCDQEYPIAHTIPVEACYGQDSGGLGDGVGTATSTGTGTSVYVDHSIFRYNTQDALDFGHADGWSNQTGQTTFLVQNSVAYGNGGGTWKPGGYFNSIKIYNTIAVGDCVRMFTPFTGTANPTYYSTNSNGCRAGDFLPFDILPQTVVDISNNTFATYHPTVFDIACWDPTTCAGSSGSISIRNNILIGYVDPNTPGYNGQLPGLFYWNSTQPLSPLTYSNNIFYNIRNLPSPIGTNLTSSPALIGQPTGTDTTFVEGQLDNFNAALTSGSPAIGAGTSIAALTTDYSGIASTSPSVIGALNYTTGTPTVGAPTFSPVGGSYSSSQTVSILDATSGAVIHYTTDGSTPTSGSATYSGPITISSTQTIKAIAVESGYTDSAVSPATYTISSPGPSVNRVFGGRGSRSGRTQ